MCVLGPGDHSTHSYEVGVGRSCLLKGLRKWEQKRLPAPQHTHKEHLRGFGSAEGSLWAPGREYWRHWAADSEQVIIIQGRYLVCP